MYVALLIVQVGAILLVLYTCTKLPFNKGGIYNENLKLVLLITYKITYREHSFLIKLNNKR